MSLLKRWQETSWYSTLGAKVAVALLATAAAILLSASASWAQTSTPTRTSTPTPTATPNVPATQTAITIAQTATSAALTTTALVPTLTPSNTATPTRTPTITPTRTNTPTPNATQTANAILTAIATVSTPVIVGTPGVTCAVQVGQSCTVASSFPGGPEGSAGKVSSFTFNVTATAPAGTIANSNPFIFISTTVGVESQANNASFTCSAVTAGAQTVCQGRTTGDILQGGEFRIRFATPGTPAVGITPANFTDLVGIATGPGVAGAVTGAIAPVPPPAVGLPPAVPQVGIPAVPRPPVQFIPPAPAPLLPPTGPLQGLQGAAAPPRYPEVPVIPETDSLALILGGLAAIGAVALYRRRRN